MAAKTIGGDTNTKIHAGGRVYQAGEFVCEWCKVPLVLDTYYTIDGKNVCQSCRNKERCASCGFLITETKYVTVDDKLYHPDCFVCSECFIELQKFHLKDDKLFCPECVHGTPEAPADPCGKCGLQLKGDIIKALGKRFHEQCFVCHCCFKDFPNDEFVNVSGNPFCDNCINDKSYLRSTAHIKATGGPAGGARGGAGASSSAGSGSGAGSGAGAGAGYGAGAGSGAGAGAGAGAYGASGGAPRSAPAPAASYGAGGAGAGGAGSSGAGAYGAGAGAGASAGAGAGAGGAGSGYGAGAGAGAGAGGAGAGAGGAGSGYGAGAGAGAGGAGAPRSVEAPTFSVGQVKNDDLQYATVDGDEYDLSKLPPKGESKYAKKSKTKFGGGVKEEKRQRDYKSKPALGFSDDSEHLKDLESLKYMTIRK